jgi:hypothetical protein
MPTPPRGEGNDVATRADGWSLDVSSGREQARRAVVQ